MRFNQAQINPFSMQIFVFTLIIGHKRVWIERLESCEHCFNMSGRRSFRTCRSRRQLWYGDVLRHGTASGLGLGKHRRIECANHNSVTWNKLNQNFESIQLYNTNDVCNQIINVFVLMKITCIESCVFDNVERRSFFCFWKWHRSQLSDGAVVGAGVVLNCVDTLKQWGWDGRQWRCWCVLLLCTVLYRWNNDLGRRHLALVTRDLPLELHGDNGRLLRMRVDIFSFGDLVTESWCFIRVIAPLSFDWIVAAHTVVLSQDTIDGVTWVDQLLGVGLIEHGHARVHVLVLALAHPLHHLVPYDPVDAGHTWDTVLGTHPITDQSLPDLPCEHGGVLTLILGYGIHNMWSGNFGFAASNDTSSEGSCLIKSW